MSRSKQQATKQQKFRPTQPGGRAVLFSFLFFSFFFFIYFIKFNSLLLYLFYLNSIHSFNSFNSNSIQIQFKFEARFLTTPASSSHARSARHALPGQVGPGQGRSHGLLANQGRHGCASATIRRTCGGIRECYERRTPVDDEAELPRKEEKDQKNQRNPKKREKSLFDPGRHFPVPYYYFQPALGAALKPRIVPLWSMATNKKIGPHSPGGGSRDFLFFSSSLFILLNSIHSFSSFKFNSNSIQIQFKFNSNSNLVS